MGKKGGRGGGKTDCKALHFIAKWKLIKTALEKHVVVYILYSSWDNSYRSISVSSLW